MVKAGESNMCGGQWMGNLGNSCSLSAAICWQDSFLLGQHSANCTRPAHGRNGSLLYPKSTNLNVNFIQKHLHRNIQSSV